MADTAHRLTDEKLEEMEKRLSDIVEVHVPEPAKMTLNQAPRELDAKLLDAVNYSGDTGNCYGAHLHFEVRWKGQRTNPLNWLDNDFSTASSEGLDTTTERELLAQLWWDGAALADRTRSEEKEND